MRASIYFIQFLKDDAASVGGGGIGTLISLLCPLLESFGHEVTVYQCADRPFDVRWGRTRVVGVPGYPGRGRSNERVVQGLRDRAGRDAGSGDRLEIFAADFFSVRNANPFAICVQNGISWDADIRLLTQRRVYHTAWGEKLFRYRCQLRGLRRFETCRNRVAVDLFFLNWYRSFRGPQVPGRIFYNPNPAPEAAWDPERERRHEPGRPLRVIFARRFFPEKGTRLVATVFAELLRLRPAVRVTLAGEGPDLEFFERAFAGDPRVTITSYQPQDALAVHREHDVAIVPSVCGEATCLSVLEAMSAGCAVVATSMGGMITQVLDGHNGVLCDATAESLLAPLVRLVDDGAWRSLMQRRGWEVSQATYGMARWRDRWRTIIRTVADPGACARTSREEC